jgi:hypothetical protein
VHIDDDGDGMPSNSARGLGSAMLDEVALDWRLGRTRESTQLHVDLAIEAGERQET